jgi:membrane-associated HD superfamily phosphohydrolase
VTEPTTTITDYLLAAECIFFGALLLRNNPLWGVSFFALAVAAAAGGTYHGFISNMTPPAAQAIWKLTLYSIGIATLLMLFATLLVYMPKLWKHIFLAITVIQFLVYVYIMSGSNDFRYVIYNYVLAMMAILLMALFHKNFWLVGAVLISFAGAAIQRSGVQLHKHFNFNDIYHLVQMVAMYFFYRGGEVSEQL